MQSNGSTDSPFEVFSKDDDFILDNIESVFPIVKRSFACTTDSEIALRGLKIAFGPCLNIFTLEDLEEELFQYSCPASKRLFLQSLVGIENNGWKEDNGMRNACEVFTNLLNICQEIVSLLIAAFDHLTKLSVPKLSNIRSLLLCSSEVLNESYKHCSKSEEFYGSYFSSLSDSLKSFFKKAQELQGHLLRFLNNIESCHEQDDINDLDEVLTSLSQSGMALMNLDVKTMADLWKMYTNLVGKHSEQLKTQHEISKPISFLSTNIINNLETFISGDKADPSTFAKTVKVLCFILKLIIKFCEIFCGYLGKCQRHLIELLVILSKIGDPQLEMLNLSNEVDADALKQLTIGVDPLLNHLINNNDFVQEFAKAHKTVQNNYNERLAFLLLSSLIVKKLISSNAATRKLWFGSDVNIADWMFELITKSNFEFCTSVKFHGVLIPGKPRRASDFYEYLYTIMSAFFITASSKEFDITERLLLKYILSTNPWCSLLATDIWCILARFADADLCQSQLMNLCRIYLELKDLGISLQTVFLESLIQRLFPLVSQNHRDAFGVTYPVEKYPHLWKLFDVRDYAETFKSVVKMNICCMIARTIGEFLSKDGQKTTFLEMESALIACNMKFNEENSTLEESLANLWKYDCSKLIVNPIHERFLKSLCSATGSLIALMNPKNIFQVLERMKLILPNLSPTCKLYCLENLSHLSRVVIPEGRLQAGIFQLISTLYYEFLDSENVFVQMRSMEVFSEFASVTRHTQLITQSVNKSNHLRSILTNYLQRKHAPNENEWQSIDFLRKLEGATYTHVCRRDRTCKYNTDDVSEPFPKKIKLDQELVAENSQLERSLLVLQREATNISQYRWGLSGDQKKELTLIVNKLLKILE